MKIFKRLFFVLLAFAFVFTFAGCSGDDDSDSVTSQTYTFGTDTVVINSDGTASITSSDGTTTAATCTTSNDGTLTITKSDGTTAYTATVSSDGTIDTSTVKDSSGSTVAATKTETTKKNENPETDNPDENVIDSWNFVGNAELESVIKAGTLDTTSSNDYSYFISNDATIAGSTGKLKLTLLSTAESSGKPKYGLRYDDNELIGLLYTHNAIKISGVSGHVILSVNYKANGASSRTFEVTVGDSGTTEKITTEDKDEHNYTKKIYASSATNIYIGASKYYLITSIKIIENTETTSISYDFPVSVGTNEASGRTLTQTETRKHGDTTYPYVQKFSFTDSNITYTISDSRFEDVVLVYSYSYDSTKKIIYAGLQTVNGMTYEENVAKYPDAADDIKTFFSGNLLKYKYELGSDGIVSSLTPLASNKWYLTNGFQSDGYSSQTAPYINYHDGYYFYETYANKEYCFNQYEMAEKELGDKIELYAVAAVTGDYDGVPVDESDVVTFPYTVDTENNTVTIKDVPTSETEKSDLVLKLSDDYVYYDDSAAQ